MANDSRMAPIDGKSCISIVSSLTPAVRTATATGTDVLLENYNSAVFVFKAGVVTDGTPTPTLEHSVNGTSGWTTVAAGDIDGTLVAMTTGSIQTVNYKGNNAHVRAVITFTGATTGALCDSFAILGNPRHAPTGVSSSVYIN